MTGARFLTDYLRVDFRMEFTPDEWERERLGWRAIVQLNIVRQILTIIHLLESELEGGSTTSTDRDVRGVVDDAVETQISGVSSTEAWKSPVATSMEYRPRFTQKHRNLITWLGSRLPEVEHELKSWLTPHSVYYSTMIAPLISATPFEPGEELDDDMLVRKKVMEYTFRSWRDVLDAAPQLPTSFSTTTLTPTVAGNSKSFSLSIDGLDMPTQAIANLRKDIKALWSDADVRAVVKWRRLEIPDSIGL
jgi:guanine nucleotide-binding protein subunit alpha